MAEAKSTSNEKGLTLTRYLYSLDKVKHSLLLSILDKNSEEALFWAYEIYHSGLPEHAFSLVTNIYDDLFVFDNPDLLKPFQRILKAHEESPFAPTEYVEVGLGTMVHNLCLRKYRIEHFMETYIGVVCEPRDDPETTLKKKYFYITLPPESVAQYQTKPPIERPYLYLSDVCKFQIRKEANAVFGDVEDGEYKDLFVRHWLYFASRSPIWKERVEEFGGVVNDATKKVVFYNEAGEEDEDRECEFYDVWNMDPDEQPLEIITRIIGPNNVTYMSAIDLCRKYGGVPKMKKLARKLKVNALTECLAATTLA
jgi:hypothetical protein